MGILFSAFAVLGVVVAQCPAPGARRSEHPAARQPGGVTAQAYYQFILGRHLESDGEIDRAIAAYREAARLNPLAAEIRAELAGLYARQGRVDEASREARAALAIDSANHEANRILGSILASLVEPGATAGDRRLDEAILKRACTSSGAVAATAPTSIRPSSCCCRGSYLRSRQHDKAIALLQELLARELVPEAYLLLADRGMPPATACRGCAPRSRPGPRRTPDCWCRSAKCTSVNSGGPTPRPPMSARPP